MQERAKTQDLDALREQINGIDDELLALFRRRMELVRDVARVKIEEGLPVFHPERERQIIERVGQRAGADAAGAQALFTTLMDVSKSCQHGLIAGQGQRSELRRRLEEALARQRPVPQEAEVACAGVEGAYAHEAAQRLFTRPRLRFYEQFDGVFEAVAAGERDYGVAPIENSIAGSVGAVYDLLRRHRLTICKSCKLPIQHSLLTLPGAPEEGLTDVYSHDQALAQCSGFFRAHPALCAHVYSNTAAAAKFVAREGNPAAAAIASPACARLYGLHIARESIQNARLNFTRFIVVSRELLIPPDADKISLSLTLPHVTGSLSRVIARFAAQRLNLTKLESRPLPDTDFEFLFYFDIEGSVRDEAVQNLLCALSDEVGQFEFLGNYK